MNIFHEVLNFLLPPRCICCGKILSTENGVCPECFNKMTFISFPYCKRCGRPFINSLNIHTDTLCPNCISDNKPLFRMCRSAVRYDDTSKPAILAFKFMDKTENAKVFAKWLKIAGKDIFNEGADVIIPVPLHYLRLIKRKYNQSALLASELCLLTGLELNTSSLVKHKSTKPQVSFSGKERIKNVKGVFSVKYPQKICGRRIVLIDDVFTTGSTARECANVLLAAGAASVDVLTIARVYD